MKVKAHRDSTEVLQPCEEPLNLPSSLAAPKRSAILRLSFLTIRLVRRDHLDASPGQRFIQRVGVIRFVTDQSFRSLSGKNLSESFCVKGDFMRRSRRRVDGERKTSGKSCQRAPLRSIQCTPFITSRVSLHGLPRPSSRRGNSGVKGSMSAHSSSISSSRRAMPKS